MFKIRLPSLTNKEIYKIITNICKKENYEISKDNINKIIKKSHRNITRAVLILQASFITDEYIEFNDYIDSYIDKLINYIFNFKKTKSLLKIRQIIFNITQINVDTNYIFSNILNKIINTDLPNEIKIKIISVIANSEYNFICGDRKIIHLEYCIFSLINLLHNN